MNKHKITESIVEEALLAWLEQLGFSLLHGPDISPGGVGQERESYEQVILSGRLEEALARINPAIPPDAIADAAHKIAVIDHPNPYERNRLFHKCLIEGVPVQYKTAGGRIKDDIAWPIDFHSPENNDFLAVNQFTVVEGKRTRRPDIVLFINGLPLGVIELKNPADKQATIDKAFRKLQNYKDQIPSLMSYNELLIISDGNHARFGTLTGNWEWFMPWRTADGETLAPKGVSELETLIKGMCAKERLLDLIRNFIVFEVDSGTIVKKMAGYHQYHAVNRAVASTVQATSLQGDKRVGVVWHTQGSGKSLTMAFFAGKIIQHRAMENPTLVVLTDRNDLDDQLFGTFAACKDLLRQKPQQAADRGHLRELLKRESGGVIFTTVQKFDPEEAKDKYPLLSERRNIVFIADEAHRSQYGFKAKIKKDTGETSYGFAKYIRDALPNASFIGFTGTPIELTDKNTRAVFGDYIDVYDIQRAVDDKATVPIYYEGRMAKIALDENERPRIDPDFEDVTEGEEPSTKEKLKSKWARLEAMVGNEKRVKQIAEDLVKHWEARLAAKDGKAMIVCMSRRICVELYNEIIALRPDWHDEDDAKGVIKIVMTGSTDDPKGWQTHIRTKKGREDLAKRFKDPNDPMKLVIVRDMWLTGFDVPCLTTMYVDKPMRGHGLMQAIARVNRVFRDKKGGLVVDYLGLAENLRLALVDFTEGDRNQVGIPQEEAVAAMMEKYDIVLTMLHGFDYKQYVTGSPEQRLAGMGATANFVLGLEDGKKRFMRAVTELSQAFALSVPHEMALGIRDELGFFQSVQSTLAKTEPGSGKTSEELDLAIRQIVSEAVVTDKVVDIFEVAGLKKPDISILSDDFLAGIRDMPHKNLALELLRKLLSDEIRSRERKNIVQARSFAEMLEATIRRYQNKTLESAEVIEELIRLAKEIQVADKRGEDLGLSEEEVAFYDALEVNDSAVKVLGDEILKTIAHELVSSIRQNVTIDWNLKESARAHMRVIVKRLLKKYGYPPDKQESATATVIKQAELLCNGVAA